MTDYSVLLQVIEDIRTTLALSGPSNSEQTISRIKDILDRQEVVDAAEQMKQSEAIIY